MSSGWSVDTTKSVTRPLTAAERGDMTTKRYNGNGGYGLDDWLELGLSMANGAYNIASAQESKATQASWRREDQAREDSVLQRSRADAQKAGFSPLAALSSNLGSSASPIPVDTRANVNSPLSDIANRRYLREQLAMQRQLAQSQISNTDADTRDKNASADVNEATTAVQILKAKAELDGMIANNNISTAQVVKYLNDMKSEGISDNVIDSLLAQFESSPTTPAVSASDLSGNKLTDATIAKLKSDKSLTDDYHALQSTIASEYNLESNKELRSALGDAQKLSAEYEAKLRQLDYDNQNADWTVNIPSYVMDDGRVMTEEVTGKPYEIINKYNLFFKKYEKSYDAREIRVNPTESNGIVKSIKSFLELFKGFI